MSQPVADRSPVAEARGSRGAALLAGLVTGLAGLATSSLATGLLGARSSPRVAVGEVIIAHTPGPVAEFLIQLVSTNDKPFLKAGVSVGLLALSALAGLLARGSVRSGQAVFLVMGVIGFVAGMTRPGAGVAEMVPALVGVATWLVVLPLLTNVQGRDEVPGDDRRQFLIRVGGVALAAGVVALLGDVAGQGRRAVSRTRSLLRLPVTQGRPPAGSDLGVPQVAPWRSSNDGFYRIDTALSVPSVKPQEWRLRIHGLVDRELTLTYQDLLDRTLTEAWVTLCCVSNDVGGSLIGNAWWSGVRIADILAEVGVQAGADAVRQTSVDGWNCGTPLAALTDDRNALLAVAMNGTPLPIEHGFPVRMVVPGLYGYVSATKWVTDLEVTRFADFTAYWTDRGWSAKGPVKTQSRIDVPRSGDSVPAGALRVGGSAWAQHTGIERVEYRLDGGPWRDAELGAVPSDDTWVQWAGQVDVTPGDHRVTVRATDRSGYTQTPVPTSVVPDGATGWHQVGFSAG